MPDKPHGIFKGISTSVDDILPCPRCYSLRSKAADIPGLPYYERRYQCKDCGQFYRFDSRPVELGPDFVEKEGLNYKPNVASAPEKQ